MTLADAETRLDVAECILNECGTRTGEVVVYELFCQNPYNGMGELYLAADELDVSVPKMVHSDSVADERVPVYVGESVRPVERLYEHCVKQNNNVPFTALFPPDRIKALTWCEDKEEARRLEHERAQDIFQNWRKPIVGGGK